MLGKPINAAKPKHHFTTKELPPNTDTPASQIRSSLYLKKFPGPC